MAAAYTYMGNGGLYYEPYTYYYVTDSEDNVIIDNRDAVPKQAMTLTLSFIMNVPHAICTVPTDRKANAVVGALCGPVTTECPASILRYHNDAALFLDAPAASKLPENI